MTFALETTLKQLFKLASEQTRPEEQLTKQLLDEFSDKVLQVRANQLKQVVAEVSAQIGKNADVTMDQLRELLNEQTLSGGVNGGSGGSGVEIEDHAANAEMARLKEQLFLARKDLICA